MVVTVSCKASKRVLTAMKEGSFGAYDAGERDKRGRRADRTENRRGNSTLTTRPCWRKSRRLLRRLQPLSRMAGCRRRCLAGSSPSSMLRRSLARRCRQQMLECEWDTEKREDSDRKGTAANSWWEKLTKQVIPACLSILLPASSSRVPGRPLYPLARIFLIHL